jgi:hypothetical protein
MILLNYSVIYHQITTNVYHEWLADNDFEKDIHNTCEGILPALTAKQVGRA